MSDPGRRRLQDYRALLAQLDFRPSRRLGQNFLLEPELHRRLLEAVAPGPEDLVLEVGAGLGFLTRELSQHAPVVAVEVDPRLHGLLVREIGSAATLLQVDVLERNEVHPQVQAALREGRRGGRLLVVANLPYAISGPLLAALIRLQPPPDAMAVLVQREFADRLVARPGSKEYGALSVQAQLAYGARILRHVPAAVFWPRPRVDSAMVHLAALDAGTLRLPAAERARLGQFLRRLFAARRKKVRNALALAGGPALPDPGHLAPGVLEQRPDTLSPPELLALWRGLEKP